MAYKPARIARPSIIANAASVLHAQIERSAGIPDDERDLWHNATMKAHAQLMDGVRFERREDDLFIFPSRSRNGIAHETNGACTCEASAEQGKPCWHRAAKRLILLIEESERATLVQPQPASSEPAPTCACGAQLFRLGERWQCVACHTMRPIASPAKEAATEAEAEADDLAAAAEEWQHMQEAARAEQAAALRTLQPQAAPARHAIAYRCPACGQRMPASRTPAGEAAYQCSNPACQKTISAASADYAAQRVAA